MDHRDSAQTYGVHVQSDGLAIINTACFTISEEGENSSPTVIIIMY